MLESFSERTIRWMFADVSGVLEWAQEETHSKRGYRTWRIPESVAESVPKNETCLLNLRSR